MVSWVTISLLYKKNPEVLHIGLLNGSLVWLIYGYFVSHELTLWNMCKLNHSSVFHVVLMSRDKYTLSAITLLINWWNNYRRIQDSYRVPMERPKFGAHGFFLFNSVLNTLYVLLLRPTTARNVYQLISPWTKWPPFRRRYFDMKILHSLKFVFKGQMDDKQALD